MSSTRCSMPLSDTTRADKTAGGSLADRFAAAERFGPDEVAVLALIAERLPRGRREGAWRDTPWALTPPTPSSHAVQLARI
jgi:hypothetical protein